METAKQFGRNLSTARKEAGTTQGELAARVYMDQGGLSLMERGYRYPRLDQMVKLAGAVGVQVRDLLYGIE
jgi:transcriptional regulator with XRE-family HTH domain